MRRWFLLLAVLFGGWATPAAAQNCVIVNGVTTCANTFRFRAPTFTVTVTPTTDAVSTLGDATHNFKQGYFGGAVALATTSTDGLVLQNTTAASSVTTAQYSPRLKVCGAAWNSTAGASETDCWVIENRPSTNAGTTTHALTFLSSLNAGSYTSLGNLDSAGTWNMQQFSAANSSYFQWNGRVRLYSSADALFNVWNQAQSFGVQVNTGTAAPTVGTCGTGTITTPSRNSSGSFTATGAAACTVTFGAPNWTNTPTCVITATKVPTTVPYISAISASAFTVSGMTAGDNLTVNFICLGPV